MQRPNRGGITRRSLGASALIPDALWKVLVCVRPTNWVYLVIFITSSTRFAAHAGPYIRVISGGKRDPWRIVGRARLQIGFCKDYRVRSGRSPAIRSVPQ